MVGRFKLISFEKIFTSFNPGQLKKGNPLSVPSFSFNFVSFVIFVKSTKDKSLLSEKAFVPIVKFGKQELKFNVFMDV